MVSATVAVGGALLLLTAAVEHMLHFTRLRAVLIAQRVVPYRLHRTLAVGLVGVEFGVGSGACVTVLTLPFVRQTVFFAEAGVYGLFLGYLTFLRFGRGPVPCGCFGDGPVRAQILVRAGVFAVAAAATAVLATEPLVTLTSVPLMGAALVVAVAARVLPGMSSRRI
ncbi:MauE/DoxX family redox-associated membrane protein [Actinopolymorpha sp. B17G11]|uniref:MauE/DoxX family redox-associated membrane protein n=1 Tax=unclassified Actinopolymorpha TaxID=2627063 RepID=UPI0032D919E6